MNANQEIRVIVTVLKKMTIVQQFVSILLAVIHVVVQKVIL